MDRGDCKEVGGVLIVLGFIVWFVGALKSDMDESITENKLKKNGLLICTAQNMKLIRNVSTDASHGKCGDNKWERNTT